MLCFRKVLGAALAVGLSVSAIKADELKPDTALSEVDIGNTADSSIVWLNAAPAAQLKTLAAAFAGDANDVVAIYDGLGGFAVRMSPQAAMKRLAYLRANASRAGAVSELEARLGELARNIEPDGYVELFDTDEFSCNNSSAEDLQSGEMTVAQSYWLGQVGAPIVPKNTNFASKVWIVDSGIAKVYNETANKELNIDTNLSVECNNTGCQTEAQGGNWNDKLGHGTMVAGIIGSIKGNNRGFVGVAPGVTVVAVKVFKQNARARWTAIYKALDYVATNATAQDVVNISWGARWDPEPYDPNKQNYNPRKIEEDLRALASGTNKLRIAVAAGNADQVQNSGYVQTITPGRAGSYFPSSGGMVLTASASDSQDVFWEFSGFGNGNCNASNPGSMKCEGPPTFAEPGVAIKSLWPKKQFNECTGTSFSTAVLSGLLVQRDAIQPLKQVTGDPSAPAGKLNQADWLGGCTKVLGTCTEK